MLERTPGDRRKRRLSLYGPSGIHRHFSGPNPCPSKGGTNEEDVCGSVLVFLVSSVALAQGKTNVQWKCDKPSDQHSIPVGNKPGDAYAIEQINCTALKGD